jgi:hypothetical protein
MYICKAQVEFNESLEGRTPTGSGYASYLRVASSTDDIAIRLHNLPDSTDCKTWYRVEVEVINYDESLKDVLIKGQWFKLIMEDSIIGIGTIQRRVKESEFV